jgi:acetylglutamate kinase
MSEKQTTTDKDKSRDDWLAQARTLSEALPYMRRHSGETLVIKYGGHAMGDDDLANLFARDIVLLRQIGANPVVVHGGGPQIGEMLDRLKVKSEFVEGLRVTDEASIEIVEMVLSGTINKQIVSSLNAAGALPLACQARTGTLLSVKNYDAPDATRTPISSVFLTLDWSVSRRSSTPMCWITSRNPISLL